MRASDEAALKDLEKRFERWRRTRQPRERIPDALWAAAAKLTRRHSIHKVSRRLRLNSKTLKQRASGGSSAQGGDPGFVEIPWSRLERETAASCLVEIRRGDGAVMTLSIPREGGVDMAVVIRSFLGRDE